jgi:hypothetical protein
MKVASAAVHESLIRKKRTRAGRHSTFAFYHPKRSRDWFRAAAGHFQPLREHLTSQLKSPRSGADGLRRASMVHILVPALVSEIARALRAWLGKNFA